MFKKSLGLCGVFLTIFITSICTQNIEEDSPILWLKPVENNVNWVKDLSPSENDLRLIPKNASLIQNEQYGPVLYFEKRQYKRKNIFAMLKKQIAIDSDTTIEAFVYPMAVEGKHDIITNNATKKQLKKRGWVFSIKDSELYFGGSDDGSNEHLRFVMSEGADIVPEEWVHLAVVFYSKNTDVKFYKNGKLLKIIGFMPHHFFNTPNATYIGNWGYDPWKGYIKEIRIYKRALTQKEIFQHYKDIK
jgi:hypothetical protein